MIAKQRDLDFKVNYIPFLALIVVITILTCFYASFVFGEDTDRGEIKEKNQVLRSGWEVRRGQSPLTTSGIPEWVTNRWSDNNWLNIDDDIDVFWNKANFWIPTEQTYWMRYQLAPKVDKKLALFIFDTRFVSEVYIDQKRLFQNLTLKKSQNWTIINFNSEKDKNNIITIKFEIPTKKDAHLIPPQIHLSTTKNLFNNLIASDLFRLISGIIFSFIGLISIIVYFRNPRINAFFYFGMFTGCYGLSDILNNVVFNLWLENPALYWGSLSILWSIGMMGFFDEVISPKKKSLLWFAKWWHIIYCIIMIPIAFYDFSYAILIGNGNTLLLGLDVLCIIITIVPKALEGDRYAKIVTLGLAIVGTSGAFSILSNLIIDYNIDFFRYGMLIFVLTIIYLIEQMYIDARENLLSSKKELEAKNVELEKLNQLKDEFLANTSHEFKTPLHGIIGMAEAIVSQNLSKSDLSISLQAIISNGRRLTNLVNDLLDTAKLKFQEPDIKTEPYNLWQLAEIVITLLKPLAVKSGIELINQIEKNTKSILADSDKLQQIFYNLIGNALKYSEKGKIEIFSEERAGFHKISIKDEGIGIEVDMQKNIFSAFIQGDSGSQRKFGGAGLGLSISKKLIEVHGGTISLTSKPNIGSTFTFTIPSCDNEAKDVLTTNTHSIDDIQPTLTQELPIEPTENINSHTVLVVDDEPLNLKIVGSQLLNQNIKVINASTGLEALACVEFGKPDLVLLDIMMPEMDGFEVCKTLRKSYSPSELPIVFLTAKNQIEDTLKGFKVGGNDYLTKPFSKDELLARVKIQLQLLTSKERMISLRNFSNNISDFKDIEQLLELAFQCLSGEKYLLNGGLFLEEKLVKTLNKETDTHLINQFENFVRKNEDLIVSGEDANILLATVSGFEEYKILLESFFPFSELDLEYTKNIIDQLNITRQNLYTLVNDSSLITILALVAANLNKIETIQSQDKYCIIITEKHLNFEKLHRIRLKTLKLYFPEEKLLQVHRSYLVNPQKVSGLRKKNRGRYDLYVGNEIVPVGSSFLNKIRTNIPELRELN
jgi:two-component system, sensor histidine kinase ChiS